MTDDPPADDDGSKITDATSADTEHAVLVAGQTIGPEPPPDFSWSTNAIAAGQGMFPQMLIQYFKGTTNSEVYVTTPVQFTPPGPPLTRGSSATYISK